MRNPSTENPPLSEENPAPATTRTRVVLGILLALLGAAAWLTTTSIRDRDRAEESLKSAETELDETRVSLGRSEGLASNLRGAKANLESQLSESEAQLDSMFGDYGRLTDSAIEFLGTSLSTGLLVERDVGICVAEHMVEESGSAAEVFEMLVDLVPSGPFAWDATLDTDSIQLAAAVLAGVDRCGGSIDALINDYTGYVALQVSATGYYVEPGVFEIGEARLADLVGRADRAGEKLYVVILGSEPDVGTVAFADSVLTVVGTGTVLVVGPETIAYSTNSSSWNAADQEAAFDEGMELATLEGMLEHFVNSISTSSGTDI